MSLEEGFLITPLQESDLKELKKFTDRAIGRGYYSMEEIENIFVQSTVNGEDGSRTMCSFLLKHGEQIEGVRITYPPGQWTHGKGNGLTQQKWPFPIQQTAYFQSLFLGDAAQGKGWGGMMSVRSIEVLKKLGARGVVCHSWKESPNNSSSKYLEKMGFRVLAEHPLYWKDVDYNCTRCGSPPCQCTALEMYLRLDGQ
jgi:hypothetical protein